MWKLATRFSLTEKLLRLSLTNLIQTKNADKVSAFFIMNMKVCVLFFNCFHAF